MPRTLRLTFRAAGSVVTFAGSKTMLSSYVAVHWSEHPIADGSNWSDGVRSTIAPFPTPLNSMSRLELSVSVGELASTLKAVPFDATTAPIIVRVVWPPVGDAIIEALAKCVHALDRRLEAVRFITVGLEA